MIVVFLLKLTLCWGLSALLYALLLRQETFFRANRAYLLGSAVLGMLMALPVDWPFVGFSGGKAAAALALPAVSVGLQQVGYAAGRSSWLACLWVAYAAGAALCLARLFLGVFRLIGMRRRGAASPLPDGCVLVRTNEAQTPFSFFKWIFVPAGQLSESWELSESYPRNPMLAHERAHAQGWHSADVLFSELLCVVLWFHPLAHWYRRSLRTLHEYLADAEASEHTDRRQYGLLLIRQAQAGMSLALVNHFFQSPLKQRLVMLTRHASPALRAWKYGLVLPLFTLLFLFARQTPAEAQNRKAPRTKTAVYKLTDIEQMPEYPGGQAALSKFLAGNIKYPEAARRDSAQGMVSVTFIIDDAGAVTDIENAGIDARQDFVDEILRVVGKMPRWKPALVDGKPVRVMFTLPVRFRLD